MAVDDENGDAFRCVAGRFPDAQEDFADSNFVAVAHSTMHKRNGGLLAKNNLSAGAFGEFAMAADKVRVQVRLDYKFYLQILSRGFLDVLIHVALGIDNSRFPFRTDQVRSMRQTAEIELLEIHDFEDL